MKFRILEEMIIQMNKIKINEIKGLLKNSQIIMSNRGKFTNQV